MTQSTSSLLLALAVGALMGTGAAQASGWMDAANSVASELNKSNTANNSASSTGTNGTTSLGALAGLLNGGDQALSANTMTNAAGVMQYCVKHNLLSASGTSTLKNQLLSKLGISSTANAKSQDYQEGLGGLLNTGQGNQLNLNSLGTSQLTERVKTKACDLVLKQGKSFITG